MIKKYYSHDFRSFILNKDRESKPYLSANARISSVPSVTAVFHRFYKRGATAEKGVEYDIPEKKENSLIHFFGKPLGIGIFVLITRYLFRA